MDERVRNLLEQFNEKDFYGKIEINFQGGSVANVNITQCIKPNSEKNGYDLFKVSTRQERE